MNYIKQLQADKKELTQTIEDLNNELNNLLIYLSSSKFHGIERNFVNAAEAYGRVKNIQNLITLNL